MDARADTGGEPRIDLSKLHVGFGERNVLDPAHGIIRCEQECKLPFQRDFERVFSKRALPAIDVGLLRCKNNIGALREGRSFGNGDGLRGASGNALCRQAIGGREAPSAIGQRANPDADGFALGERANLSVFCGQVALPQMHEARIAVGSAAEVSCVESEEEPGPHLCDFSSPQSKRNAAQIDCELPIVHRAGRLRPESPAPN